MGWFTTTVRRSLWLALIVAAGGAVWTWRRDSADASAPGPATWPPLDTAATRTASEATMTTTDKPTLDAPVTPAAFAPPNSEPVGGWAEPLADGSCPPGYPIKANDNSGIFHLPDGRFYDRTKPERCYSDANAALADGYRRAKN